MPSLMKGTSTATPTPRQMGDYILISLPAMIAKTDASMKSAQDRYKRYFDRTVRPMMPITPGTEVCVNRIPDAARTEADRIAETVRSKLRPKTDRSFKVLTAGADTVTIEQDGIPNTVTIDRVTPVPTTRDTYGTLNDVGDHEQPEDSTHDETDKAKTPMNIKMASPPGRKLDEENLSAHASTRLLLTDAGGNTQGKVDRLEDVRLRDPTKQTTQLKEDSTRNEPDKDKVPTNVETDGPPGRKTEEGNYRTHVRLQDSTEQTQRTGSTNKAHAQVERLGKVRLEYSTKQTHAEDNLDASATTTAEYTVERVIAHRTTPGRRDKQYRVRWYGFSAKDDTYEPAEHIPAHFIARYWKRRTRRN